MKYGKGKPKPKGGKHKGISKTSARWRASCSKAFGSYYEVVDHEKECWLCLRRLE